MIIKELRIRPENENIGNEMMQQVREILESLSGSVAVVTVGDDGTLDLIFANSYSINMLGYTRDSFYEEDVNLLEIVHPDDRDTVAERVLQASKDKKQFDITYRIIKPNGDIMWCESKVSIKSITGIEVPAEIILTNDITERMLAKEEKRIHSEEMQTAVAQMGKMICEYDVKKQLLHIPEAYANLYGLSMPITNVPYAAREPSPLSPESVEPYIWLYEEIFRGVKTDSVEVRIQRLDGSWRWERYKFNNIFGDDGKPVKAIIIVEDITEHYEARLALQREQHLRQELIKDAFIYYKSNLTTGIIEEYHSEMNDVAGMFDFVEATDELHAKILENILPEYHQSVADAVFPCGLWKRYERGESYATVDYRRKMPDGKIHWVRAIGNIMERTGSGEVIVFIHIHDIDFDKKSQLAIDAITNQRLEAFCLIDIKNRNARMPAEMLGIATSENYVLLNYDEYVLERAKAVSDEDRQKYLDALLYDNIIKNLEYVPVIDFQYKMYDKDGNEQYKRTSGYYLDETHEDIVLSRSDVTTLYREDLQRQKELQEAVTAANKANQAKNDFLSRMSHDMRTPLNAILSLSSDEMLKGTDEETKNQWFEDIYSSGEYLLGLINDMLDVSRIEARVLKLAKAPYSILDFQSIIETTIGSRCKEKNIEFVFAHKNIEYLWIVTDKTRFNQIFINLLSNAVKYTQEGGRIEFDMETLGYENERLMKQFTVRDNGIGMSSEFLPHAFEYFSQELRAAADVNNQGTGLGLAIVKNLVELMEGTISVKSQLGEGTEFTVVLPIEKAEPVEKAKTDEKVTRKLKGRRILICEDHALNAKITGVLLEKQGCITERAENGKVGLDMFRNSQAGYYDAILMDIRMPVMDGWEATAVIRELNRSDAQTVPIIALTADAFSESEKNALARGMSGYLSKPIDTQLMYEMIAAQL